MNNDLQTRRRCLPLNIGAALALLAGCRSTPPEYSAIPELPPPVVEQRNPTEDASNTFKEFEENGHRYLRGTMAFPTGEKSSSGLLLEKIVPAQVTAGNSFQYIYRVHNLTHSRIGMVKVMDLVTTNFIPSDAIPKATKAEGGIATWDLGELVPDEVSEIRVTGIAKSEGSIQTCGWATYSPILCMPIEVTLSPPGTNTQERHISTETRK